MELLLNLCWLLLTVPAFYCWMRRRNRAESRPYIIIVALTCLLTLLFPVVSASDDLHAMRQEMEDSNATKRSLKQAGVDHPSPQSSFSDPPAQLTSAVAIPPSRVLRLCITDRGLSSPNPTVSRVDMLRGPPPSRLS
jgi:hypothetical protein